MDKVSHRKFSGENLKKHRKAKKLSVMRLCRSIDFVVGPGAINDYEKDLRSPNVNVMLRIARALKISPQDLTK